VILFSHPADFTPVCSTELIEFAKRSKEFEKLNQADRAVDRLDPQPHGLAREPEADLRRQIDYPMIADIDMKVASLYGMIHPGASSTATVRSVFVIDPKHTIRALVYYPMNVGRNCDEVKRLLEGLQTADKLAVACPVNWKPGEKVIVPRRRTRRSWPSVDSHKEYEKLDFYLRKKALT
jgi:peroxiredoxin (alkyl hydroperoxide reductase subunit C)